ncbi:hypothetical protein Y032_0142g2345 [Ancylostoma ceylanicum]|uniref:Uncharacterized protein n=1 Tax=Ancylostoma ceylanicum TaxID=53326 RepID=A0A016T2T0_9BILA|nr:hypothetical protein Y032_0142g2345 [Ancylostoma ceylanicum]
MIYYPYSIDFSLLDRITAAHATEWFFSTPLQLRSLLQMLSYGKMRWNFFFEIIQRDGKDLPGKVDISHHITPPTLQHQVRFYPCPQPVVSCTLALSRNQTVPTAIGNRVTPFLPARLLMAVMKASATPQIKWVK